MAISTALAIGAATSGIKKIVDDIYTKIKDIGVNRLGKARAEVKEQPITRALLSVTKVKTLWNIDKEVSLYDFYYPSTIEFAEGNKKKISKIRDFGSAGHFVIQGTAGQGKSIFLRFLCGQELRPDHSSGRIPIFVELRRLRLDLNLIQLILQNFEKYKLPASESAWTYLAETGKFVLLLDAFDEIDPSISDRTIAELELIAETFRESLQIIVTSRPDADVQKSSHFRVFKLAQLTHSDHAPFLRKICTDREQAESLLKVVKESSTDVSGLLTTPLMMTLLVILYKSLQTIPDTVPKFYEELFDVLFYRHDHSKPGFRRKRHTQLDDGSVKKLFSAVCLFARVQGLSVLSNEQLEECFTQATEACLIITDYKNFKLELIKTICLLQEEGFEVSFIHKSVAQYYAASFVSKSAEPFAEDFYNLARTEAGWGLELKFLSQIDTYRFYKLYELPLLQAIASEMNFSLEMQFPEDQEKIKSYFIKTISLVAYEGENIDPSVVRLGGTPFVGWSSIYQQHLEKKSPAYAEFGLFFTQPVRSHLNRIKAPIRIASKQSSLGPKHHFIPISAYAVEIDTVANEVSADILKRMRERYAKGIAVIELESRKPAMLSKFLKKRPHNHGLN
jgi:hypothetical protein